MGGGRLAIKLDRPVRRGQALAVPRADLPPPEPGSYYIFELVGLAVQEGARELGVVKDVIPGAANDNLVLDDGRLVPLVEDAIAKVDVERGRILLNPGFTD